MTRAVETVKGEALADFRDRYGDWGLAMIFYLSRQRTGLTLRELGDLAGGMDYKNVSTLVRRFKQQIAQNPSLAKITESCNSKLTIDET